MIGLSDEEDVVDLSSFYAFLSATCFTLVGLWWNVLERRPQLLSNARGAQARRAASTCRSCCRP